LKKTEIPCEMESDHGNHGNATQRVNDDDDVTADIARLFD